MRIKSLVFVTLLTAWRVAPVHAGEQYRFRVAEGLEALGDEKLPDGMERLRGRPLMVLIEIEGTHWRWVLNGCPENKRCEFRINDSGGGGGDPDEDPATLKPVYDLGLVRIDATRFRLRCLRELCVIGHGPVGAKELEGKRLLRGEWIELFVERVIDAKFSAD
jgi:hypothetical protein